MKIYNNYLFNNNLYTNNSESQNKNHEFYNNQYNANLDKFIDSKYYQSYNNISFRGINNNSEFNSNNTFIFMPLYEDNSNTPKEIKSYLTLQSGKQKQITIDKQTIQKYLINDKGKLDTENTQKFLSVMQYMYNFQDNKDKENIEFLESIANGKNIINQEYIDTREEKEVNFQDALINSITAEGDYLENFFGILKDNDLRQTIAEGLLDYDWGLSDKEELQKAKSRTIKMFELSKTSNGYSLDNFDKKMDIISAIESLEYNYSTMFNFEKDIIQESKDESGCVDLDFASTLCDFLKKEDLAYDGFIHRDAQLLKKFGEMDKDNKKSIYENLIGLVPYFETLYDGFDDIFDTTFNPVTNKFDEKAAKSLQDIGRFTYFDNSFNKYFESEEGMQKFRNLQKNIVSLYFKTVRNSETGELKEYMPAEMFCRVALGKMLE